MTDSVWHRILEGKVGDIKDDTLMIQWLRVNFTGVKYWAFKSAIWKQFVVETEYWFDQKYEGNDTWRFELFLDLSEARNPLRVYQSRRICNFGWMLRWWADSNNGPCTPWEMRCTQYDCPVTNSFWMNPRVKIPNGMSESSRWVRYGYLELSIRISR